MSSGDLIIREATKGDLDAVVTLWQGLISYHLELGDRLNMAEDAEAVWREWAAGHMESSDSRLIVAEAGGLIAGMALGMIRERAPLFAEKRYGFISDLYVVPERRMEGIGRALARHLLGWFAASGVTEVELSVASVNPEAEGFWRSLGADVHRKTMRVVL